MDSFPAFFPLHGRTVVIAGSGEGAEAKARLFDGSPARLVRLDGERAFDPAAYAGAALAFVASADDGFAARAAAAARAAGAPVNVVDRPALCDFVTPAVIDRGAVVAAVGTGGTAPLLAGLLRADIEARLPEGSGRVAALIGRLQSELRAALPDAGDRRAFLREALAGPAAEAALGGDMAAAERLLREAIGAASPARRAGRVAFVDVSGPVDGLTLRAARLMAEADLVAADPGVAAAALALCRRDAPRVAPQAAAHQDPRLLVARLTLGPAEAEKAALAGRGVRVETA